jgi:hypothetical protein
MSAEWVPVTVTVPAWAVTDIHQRAAELAAKESAQHSADSTIEHDLKEAYYGGSSALWRAFLRTLAHESHASLERGEAGWVNWPTLYNTIGITAKEASGVLGAATKRLKGHMPFEQIQEGDTYKFRMSRKAAQAIFAFVSADKGE